MSDARDEILGRIRSGSLRGARDPATTAELAARLARPHRNLIPARAASLDHAEQVELFAALAAEVDATVERVADAAQVPAAVTQYLAARNLPQRLVANTDPRLDAIPWERAPLLSIRRGMVEDGDAVGLTACFAGIAETGTLMLISGRDRPTRNNFLPDTHIVVVATSDIVGVYEDAWDRLRAQGAMPRTVNFITGPSRTGDIAQRLELGAHGPRRLHIVLVEDHGGTPAER